MLLHATISHFRKDAQLLFSNYRYIFSHPTQVVDIIATKSSLSSPQVVRELQLGHRLPDGPDPEHKQDNFCKSTPTSSPFTSDRALISSKHLRTGGDPYSRRGSITTLSSSLTPSTKWELHQHIRHLISLDPPAPFSRLLSVHGRHPTLQSVESYNVLLLLSIRHSFFRQTQFLIGSMAMNQIEPDMLTEKLVVRYLISGGNWKMAWQQVIRRYCSVADIPMPVLLELLAPGTRPFSRPDLILPSSSRPRTLDRSSDKPESGIRTKMPLDTLMLIFHLFSTLPLHDLARLPPRAVSYVVRGFIRNGHETLALLLTESHLKSLPSALAPKQVDFARDLVHHHLSSGEVKLANYKKRRRLVESLFKLHPGLYPNAKTVFLLMRYMEASQRCGIEAYLFFKNYRARWGAVVDSLDVRRRVVEFALKQRKHGIAKEISLLGPLEEPSSIKQSRNTTEPFHSSLRLRPWRSMYPRKGKGARFWKRVVIRLLEKRREWRRMQRTMR